MSDDRSRHIVTQAQRQRLHTARRVGNLCAACGRDLAVGETMWQERFTAPLPWKFVYLAPVGVECVSPAFLAETVGREPEACVGCGRGVHYPSGRSARQRQRTQALCSRRCGKRASVAKRAAKLKEG